MFDLEDWKRRMKYCWDGAERNSFMESGWSAATADRCVRVERDLLRELVKALAATDSTSEDFFARPELVAIQEAARFAVT